MIFKVDLVITPVHANASRRTRATRRKARQRGLDLCMIPLHAMIPMVNSLNWLLPQTAWGTWGKVRH